MVSGGRLLGTRVALYGYKVDTTLAGFWVQGVYTISICWPVTGYGCSAVKR